MKYTNSQHTEVDTGKASGRVIDLIRQGYLKEDDVIEPYVEPVPSADEIFSNAIQPLVFGISQVERDTFERQEREALEWQANNDALVPFIRDLAAARDITMSTLVKKITDKANIYSEHLAKALGEKHRAEDQLVDDNA